MKLLEEIDSVLLERSLYHGTVRDHRRAIEKHGLVPDVGGFVDQAYSEYREGELEPLVFAASKRDISNAATAMKTHIASKLNKWKGEVTEDDIRKHGMLAVIKGESSNFKHRPEQDEDYYGEHPGQVEPGDFYSDFAISPDFILVGNKLVDFLENKGLSIKSDQDSKDMREELIKRMVEYHREKDDDVNKIRRQAVEYVQDLSDDQLSNVLSKYRKKHEPDRYNRRNRGPEWKLESVKTESKNLRDHFDFLYHESMTDGMTKLRGSKPHYKGHIGGGVYLSPDGTGGTYGEHLYKCKLKFRINSENIFSLTPYEDSVFSLTQQGSTGSPAGEHYPFSFKLKGQRYWVGHHDSLNAYISKLTMDGIANIPEGDDPEDKALNMFYNWLSEEDKTVNIDRLDSLLMEFHESEALKVEGFIKKHYGLSYEDDPDEFIEVLEGLMYEVEGLILDELDVDKFEKFEEDTLIISLESIGKEVRKAGFKALYFYGFRVGVKDHEELLVFDEDDVEIVEQVS